MSRRRGFPCGWFRPLVACVILSIAAGQNPQVVAAQTQVVESGEIVDRVEKDLRSELMAAVKKFPALHGTWIDLNVHRDRTTRSVTGCSIEAMLDKDDKVAKVQHAEIDRIAKGFLKDYPYRVSETARLPIRSFLGKLQSRIDLMPQLAGTEISDALLDDAPTLDDGIWRIRVDLLGRVAQDERRSAVIDVANKLIDEELRDSKVRAKTIADGLKVRKQTNSTDAASYNFNQGVQSFRRREYDAAYRFLTRAAFEAPERVEYQYWRVVALLGSQRDEDASILLGNLIEQRTALNKSANMESVALRSLEQVNGPVRQRMMQLERDLISGMRDAAAKR